MAGFRPVQAITDFFVSLLLIGVNIKKVPLYLHRLPRELHMTLCYGAGDEAKRHDPRSEHHEEGRRSLHSVSCGAFHARRLCFNRAHCDRYATYDDDVALEMGGTTAAAAAAADDDADESFDLKNYDITYDEKLAGSSSDDEAPKPAASATSTADSSTNITDHLAKAQKKTMDM